MGIRLFGRRPKAGESGTVKAQEIELGEFIEAAEDYQIRELSFWVCVNMIANALGRCEVKTFRGGKEIREREYYLWNVEPNENQNATAFFHKLTARLCQDNEALIINGTGWGGETLEIADDWEEPLYTPGRMNEYKGVIVGERQYANTFREKDVMHLRLNHINIRPVMNGLYQSYIRLVNAAVSSYEWEKGQHWKVKVSQIASGEEGWDERFMKMLNSQIKPFLTSGSAILPEFDGYQYENVGGGSKSRSAEESRDTKKFIEDIFDFTARAFGIPATLDNGAVTGTEDANRRFLSGCIDPICRQLEEEGTRKRYGYEEWRAGNYMRVDSSAIGHFDLFANAADVEKLVGSGAFSINDIRRAAGQAEIREPWAEGHWMTKNIGGVTEIEAAGSEEGGEP